MYVNKIHQESKL